MARAWAYGIVAVGLALAGCGPMPLAEAEDMCRDAVAPKPPLSGEGRIGVTSGGNISSGIDLTFNLGTGGDPARAYADCVRARSGQNPSRPWWNTAGGRR